MESTKLESRLNNIEYCIRRVRSMDMGDTLKNTIALYTISKALNGASREELINFFYSIDKDAK